MLVKWPFELVVWLGGLLILAFSYPVSGHFSLCPLANVGILWCPGCGIGRSISYLFHGEIILSFKHHWFGIPALIILMYRIWQLLNLRGDARRP
jgi:hypothetical protein